MNFLRRPFPIEYDLISDLRIVLMVTIFPPVFIGLFQPVGILEGFDKSHAFNWVVLSGFGLVSGLMTLLFGVLLPWKLPSLFERMTVLGAFIYYLLFFTLIASSNYIYKTYWEGLSQFSLGEYLSVIYYTFLIGLFPLALILFLVQQRRLKFNLETAISINTKINKHEPKGDVVIRSKSNYEVLKLNQETFLYAENADNYVWVFFLNGDSLEKQLMRISMKSIAFSLEPLHGCIRIHRSFIANLNKVQKAEGNSRGLTLLIDKVPSTIPVSRKYLPSVSSYLKSLS